MAMLGTPNVRIIDLITGDVFYIDEVCVLDSVKISENEGLHNFESFWKTEFEVLVLVGLTPVSFNPNVYLMNIPIGKEIYSIQFVLEDLRFAKSNHKKCLALAIRKI